MESLSSSLNDFGLVITPKTPISKAVASLGSQGGTIILSEGEWSFFEELVITRPNVKIVAAFPGTTKFTRSAGGGSSMIRLSGANCSVEGVTFFDPVATGGPVRIYADRCSVKNCVYEDVGSIMLVLNGNYFEFSGNHIISRSGAGVVVTGTTGGKILDNTFEGTNTSYKDILCGSDTVSTVLSGNVHDYADGEVEVYNNNGMQTQLNIESTNSIARGNITIST